MAQPLIDLPESKKAGLMVIWAAAPANTHVPPGAKHDTAISMAEVIPAQTIATSNPWPLVNSFIFSSKLSPSFKFAIEMKSVQPYLRP